MRGRLVRFAGITAMVGLGLVALGERTARAQQPIVIQLSVTENREPGLAGTATLTPMGNGVYRVDLRVTGLPRNDTARPAHIHTAAGARCDTGAPVTYPLTNLVVDANGVGTSTSTVTITPDQPVTANNAYVNIHNPAQGGRGVICGNIVTTLAAQGPAPRALPATGDGSYDEDAPITDE